MLGFDPQYHKKRRLGRGEKSESEKACEQAQRLELDSNTLKTANRHKSRSVGLCGFQKLRTQGNRHLTPTPFLLRP